MPAWTKPLAANVKEKKLPPPSERYQKIKAVVNSGYNEIKLKEYLAEQNLNARFHRDENFRRIKASRIAQLLEGESDLECLLLDLRDADEFASAHIKTAISYPARLLSRAVQPLSNEVLDYVNVEDRVIVVYDWDERVAVPAATLMFEKGVNNVVLLSGGLREAAAKAPGVVEGIVAPERVGSYAPSVASTSVRSESFSAYGSSRSQLPKLARRQTQPAAGGSSPSAFATSLSLAPPSGGRGSRFSSFSRRSSGNVAEEEASVVPFVSNTPTAAAGPWR